MRTELAYSRSRPVIGFTAQRTRLALVISAKQQRQPMHLRMTFSLPENALTGQSGSASRARPIAAKSHTPSSSSPSATHGSLMLLTDITGMETAFFTAAAMFFFHPCS